MSKPIARAASVLPALFIASVAGAADGALDTAWGSGGRHTVSYDFGGTKADQAFGAALQSDGKLVVVGSAAVTDAAYPSNKDVAVSRLRGDGSLDTTFATQGRFDYNFGFPAFCANEDIAKAVAIQPTGAIVVVGTASCTPTSMSTSSSMFVMRLLSNGTLDSGFGNGGVVVEFNDHYALAGTSVALFGSHIVVAGYVDYPNQSSGPVLWVFDSGGALVTVDGPFIADAGSRATAVSVDALGDVTLSGYYKIAAAGASHTNGYDCFVTRRVPDLSGTYGADNSFGTGGTVHVAYDIDGGADNDYCYAHAVDSNGRIMIVGQAGKPGGGSFATVVRVTSSGRDFSFSNSGFFFFEDQVNIVNAFNVARAVRIRPDNRIVIAGYGHVQDSTRAPFDFGVVRFNPDGSADQSFHGSEPGSQSGSAMIGFETTSTGVDDGAFALALDNANRAYVAGQHQVSGSDYDMAIARIQSDAIFVNGFESL